jgi:hypothetical protein
MKFPRSRPAALYPVNTGQPVVLLSAAAATENDDNQDNPNAIKILFSSTAETHYYTPFFRRTSSYARALLTDNPAAAQKRRGSLHLPRSVIY